MIIDTNEGPSNVNSGVGENPAIGTDVNIPRILNWWEKKGEGNLKKTENFCGHIYGPLICTHFTNANE